MIRTISSKAILSKVISDCTQHMTFEKVYCLFRKELIAALFHGGRVSSTGSYYYKCASFKIRVSNHPCHGVIDCPMLSIILLKNNISPHRLVHPDLLEIEIDLRAIKQKPITIGNRMLRRHVREINLAINDFLLQHKLLSN